MKEEFDFESIKNKAIEQLKAGKPLLGKDGAFAPLLESILNAALEGEMDAHLTEEERQMGNRRNGKMQKQVQTPLGEVTVSTPRDRNSSFDPQFIKKRETIQIKHKDTHIAFSPDFLLNNRFSFNYKGFEAALQSQFVSKQYMTNAEVEELTLDKYFVSNLNLAYSFRPKKVLKEVTVGFTVYNLFNEKYENNGWASSDYTDTLENRGNYAGYAAQAGTNVMGHVSFRF